MQHPAHPEHHIIQNIYLDILNECYPERQRRILKTVTMKRILLSLFAALVCLAASAQYATPPQGELKAKGSRIYCDGTRLSKEMAAVVFSDFGGVDRSEDYLRYRSAYKAGVGMSVGGASLAVLGGMTFTVSAVVALVAGIPASISGGELPKGIETGISVGAASAILGTAVMLAGIPTAAVYQHRIKKMVKSYNELGAKPEPVVTFRPASSGIGIAMTF